MVKRVSAVVALVLLSFMLLASSTLAYELGTDFTLPLFKYVDDGHFDAPSGTSTAPYGLYLPHNYGNIVYTSCHVITSQSDGSDVTYHFNLTGMTDSVMLIVPYVAPFAIDWQVGPDNRPANVFTFSIDYMTFSEVSSAIDGFYINRLGSSSYKVENFTPGSSYGSTTVAVITFSMSTNNMNSGDNICLYAHLQSTNTGLEDYFTDQHGFIDTLEAILNNQGITGVVAYLTVFWTYAWIVDLIAVTVLLSVLGILFNWIHSL